MTLLAALSRFAAAADDLDPYLWLEEVDGKKPLAWVAKQNKRSEKELGSADGFEELRTRLQAIQDADDRIPWPGQIGDAWFNFWQDADHVQGVWRRTTREDYLDGSPTWETVLDLDALSASEGRSWVWHGANCLPPEYRRCLVTLSDGGSDADVTREFDLVDKAFVADGFSVPESKHDVSWIDQDHLFVGVAQGPETVTDSGYPRQVRRWTRGTPLAEAELVYEGQKTDVSVGAYHDASVGFERDWVYRGIDTFTSESWLLRDGQLLHVDAPLDADVGSWHEWLLITLKTDWTVGDTTWKAGTLLTAKLDDFLAGSRAFTALFEPSERIAFAGYDATKNHLLISALDNVRSRTWVLTPQADGTFARSEIAGLPENADYGVWAVDSDEGDEVFVAVSDFLTPPSALLGSAVPGAPAPVQFATTKARFDASGLVIEQHEVTSLDGTRVPYFQVSRKDLVLDGSHPTLMNGYGGFEIAMTPSYSGGTGAAWLEKGGVYVLTNIRGGGEFGPDWHNAALKENRHKAYEDFAAIARDLVARKVTSPEHLGAMGGSNGGLLMGNMLVQYPELFGAIVCQVPLLDMKRYSHLLAGASWMGEYGDPDVPEQWAYLQTFSPYQLVKADGEYPRILFQTSTADDRVHPGHARKMAAKMLGMKHDLLYWENTQGGHGGAANSAQRANMWALAWTFLWNELS